MAFSQQLPATIINRQLDLVSTIYEIVYYSAQQGAGMPLQPLQRDLLSSWNKLLADEPGWQRRKYRRIPLTLSAEIKNRSALGYATIHNISPGGLYLTSSIKAKKGDHILIKIDRNGQSCFSFPCRVCRVAHENGQYKIALAFSGIPLQVRYNKPTPSRTRTPLRRVMGMM